MADEIQDENQDMNEASEGEDILDMDEDEGGSKLPLIIGAVVLLLGGGGAGLYFTGMLDSVLGKGEEPAHAEEAAHGDDGHGGEAGASAVFLEIPTILVNLSTDDGTPRFLRLTVQLELHNATDRAAVEAVIPRVVDQFQTYLRELRVRDLRGSAGIYRLQTELLWRVNQASAPVKVKDVLFQEILIQ